VRLECPQHRRQDPDGCEGIGKAHEEFEERPIVNCLRDLGVAPPRLPQSLDLFVRDAISMAGQCFNKFQ